MMSAQMQRACLTADRYDDTLNATDSRFNFCVRVVREEGSIFFFERAFFMQWKDPNVTPNPKNTAERQGEWLLVFTEHQGAHAFAFDDLYSYDQYSKSTLSPQVLS